MFPKYMLNRRECDSEPHRERLTKRKMERLKERNRLTESHSE